MNTNAEGGSMTFDIIEPKLVVNSFNDENTQKYIDTLDAIALSHSPEQIVFVEIDSYGGSVHNLIRLIERFNALANPVATFCTSKAMSAGLFLLSIAGSQGLRFASPMASLMLHETQGGSFIDDINEIENHVSNMKNLNKELLDLFARRTGLSGAKAVRDLIKANSVGHNFYFDAKKAKELHIIDEICYCRLVPQTQFELQLGDVNGSKLNNQYVVAPVTKKGKKHG